MFRLNKKNKKISCGPNVLTRKVVNQSARHLPPCSSATYFLSFSFYPHLSEIGISHLSLLSLSPYERKQAPRPPGAASFFPASNHPMTSFIYFAATPNVAGPQLLLAQKLTVIGKKDLKRASQDNLKRLFDSTGGFLLFRFFWNLEFGIFFDLHSGPVPALCGVVGGGGVSAKLLPVSPSFPASELWFRQATPPLPAHHPFFFQFSAAQRVAGQQWDALC